MNFEVNTMNDKTPYDLITKYLAGECSKEEITRIENWKKENAGNLEMFNQLQITWQESSPEEHTANVDDALDKVMLRIESGNKIRIPHIRLVIGVAASVVIGLVIFSIVNARWQSKEIILTSLENAKTTKYLLPDGSKVTMNQASRLTYPKKFSKTERRVKFEGEAYFDIAPNKAKPFIIESGLTETKVLGTEFNLNTHTDSVILITVTEGLVAFSLKEEKSNKVLLEAGQVGEYVSNSNVLEKYENTDLNFLAWKNGKFQFVKQDLKKAISQLSEYYNVNFEITDNELEKVEFTATFDSLSLEELKTSLELILGVSVESNSDNLIIIQRNS